MDPRCITTRARSCGTASLTTVNGGCRTAPTNASRSDPLTRIHRLQPRIADSSPPVHPVPNRLLALPQVLGDLVDRAVDAT